MKLQRRTVLTFLLVAAAAVLALWLMRLGVERWQHARYEKRIEALETQIREADAKAKDAEARAKAAAEAAEAKEVELRDLRLRADAAESNLQTTRQKVVPLKEAYDRARNTPVPTTPVSVSEACRELAAAGYPCQ